MGKLNLYKGLNENYETIEANGKLKDILPEVDFSHCVILKAGERISADYEVQPEDIIFLRVTPSSTTAVAIVSLVFAVVSAGFAIGAAVYSSIVQQDAQEKLDNAQQEANELASKTKQLPFLKGANNRTALGYSIPYVMGSIYNTPYLLTKGFYSIGGTDGKKQYWNAILTAGFDNQVIQSVSVGNNSVLKGTESLGDISYISKGVHNVDETSVYYDENNKIEILTEGESSLDGLDQKVSGTSYSDEIKHEFGEDAEPLIKQLESNTMKVEICIGFNGLRRYSDGWKSKSVTITFEWTNNASDESPTWTKFDTLTVSRNTNETIRFVKSYTFSAEEAYGKDISVRITRTTPEEETNSNETAYLLYINSFAYDTKKSSASELVACAPLRNPWRDKTMRIAVKMIANDSTKDSLDSINVMSYGIARTWDSESQSWSDTKNPTRNPASWILELLTSDAHSHSKYNDSEIALDSLGALYEYCEEQEFYCDGLIDNSSKKRDLISNILGECCATMFINNEGLLDFAIDKAEETPIALLNSQSVKSITVAKSFERKADGKKVSFTNRDSWAVDNAYMTYDGETDSEEIYDANRTITEEALHYVTTYNHAYKLVHKSLAEAKLQPREITVDVGQEGDYYPLYSLVMLQMKELLSGISNGVIESFVTSAGKIVGLNLSDSVDLSDTSKRYGIILQACSAEGKEHIYAEITQGDSLRQVTFVNAISYAITPEVGNIYSIGELDSDGSFKTVTNLMKIYALKPSSEGWELTLKDYNSAIYDSGDIPEYKTNLTLPKTTATQLRAPTYGEISGIAGEFADALNTKVSKLFNSQLVQIYKESESVLTDDSPSSALTYDFNSKSYSWASPDSGYPSKSNGWSWEYPSNASNTVYTSYATAQSQEATASIEAEDWSAPLPSGRDGSNGMNTYTITLYTRENDAPTYLPSELTYNFSTGIISGNRNGWKLSIPSAVEDSNPCWEIHALAISEDNEATILTSKWSEPIQITSDGITADAVREIVKEELSDVVETPNVYADFNNANFAVNNKKRTVKAQEITLTVHVIQTNEELDFTFDEDTLIKNLPSGWSYSIDYHSITLKVSEGVKITSGKFVIPIIYKTFKYNNQLAFTIDNEDYILSSDGIPLGYSVFYDDSSTFDLGFTYSGVVSGVYLGTISSVSDIPSSGLILGDYFTYTGEDTASSLSQEGSFKKCGVYFYSGEANTWKWEKETDIEAIAGVMSDITSIADADLEANNSTAYEYLSHLTANSIFTDLLTANTAFISKLVGNEAIIQGTSENNYLKKAVEDSSDTIVKAISESEDKTVIEGGYLKTALINANALEITDSSGAVKTLLSGGYINTGLVKADSIEAGAITADKIGAGEVTTDKINIDKTLSLGDNFSLTNEGELTTESAILNNCKADNAEFNNCIANKLTISEGKFEGEIDSGPLYLSNDTESESTHTLTYIKDRESCKKIEAQIKAYNIKSFTLNDSISGVNFGIWDYASNFTIWYQETASSGNKYVEINYGASFDLVYTTYVAAGTKTFLLRDLPTSAPSTSGALWNNNGVLNIVS